MKHALALSIFIVVVACTSESSLTPESISVQTRELCSGIEQWAAEASTYLESLSAVCSGGPNISLDGALECKNTALEAWQDLSDMSPPVVAVATHDMLRRAIIYQIQSMRVYIENPAINAYQSYYVDSVNQRRAYQERRDLMLAMCGFDQSDILAGIEWSHSVEDYNQRMMLETDSDEYERLHQELFDLRDVRRARPPSERVRALQLIQSIAGDEAFVDYLYTYGDEESYAVDQTLFVIDPRRDILTRINEVPRDTTRTPPRELDLTALYTHDELAQMARDFISKYAVYIDLDTLSTEDHLDEGSLFHWFRWSTPDDYGVFVQIAYTPAGEIAAYTNTIHYSYFATQEPTE